MTTAPTAAEVEELRQAWCGASVDYASSFHAYNTAKATHDAANDTGRILDEAEVEALRQAWNDTYDAATAAEETENEARDEAARCTVIADNATAATLDADHAECVAWETYHTAREAHAEATL
jgi:hypothetical protein